VDAKRIGALGFCIGGMYALMAACEDMGLAASVDYYGSVRYASLSPTKPRSPLDYVAQLRAPLLGHFGTFDRLISVADLDALETTLQGSGKSYELYRYRGAPHAFDEDFRPAVFRPVAAAVAAQRTLTFLDWHLRGIPPR
jgi:carboxymethylenebutenolidase